MVFLYLRISFIKFYHYVDRLGTVIFPPNSFDQRNILRSTIYESKRFPLLCPSKYLVKYLFQCCGVNKIVYFTFNMRNRDYTFQCSTKWGKQLPSYKKCQGRIQKVLNRGPLIARGSIATK